MQYNLEPSRPMKRMFVIARRGIRVAYGSPSSKSFRVRSFYSVPDARPYINGKYHADTRAEPLPVYEPATGRQLAILHVTTSSQAQTALIDANEVYANGNGVWSSPSQLHQRSSTLNKLGSLLKSYANQLAELEAKQTGRCIREMRAQLGRVNEWFEYFAALIKNPQDTLVQVQGKMRNEVRRLPLGVVVQITPWNHPLLIAVKKIAPALAAGNSVVVKASELTPLTVLELGALAQEAGVPDGVLQILPGYGSTIGAQLTESPFTQKVDLTGSTATGRLIGQAIGSRMVPFTAELGGKAPLIVFDDHPIDLSVAGALFASFIASGQTCVSASRILIQRTIFDDFVKKFVDRARNIEERMGDPLSMDTSMGSLISEKHLTRVDGFVQRALTNDGLQCLTGGKRLLSAAKDGFNLSGGYFYPPTILAMPSTTAADEALLRESEAWRNEIFGPVVVLCPFDSETHALALANDSPYSLGASLWTKDTLQQARVTRLVSQVHAGVVWNNTHHRNDPGSPWGALHCLSRDGEKGNASGVGSENGPAALHSYQQIQSITFNLAGDQERAKTEDWFASAQLSRYG